jgi:RNA polymerase sigma-70 factor (ECF subfamily)
VDLEGQIHRLREERDFEGAATRALEGYGPELFGFLVALLRNKQDAADVFSQTCEDMWVGLPRFEGRCSMRTWLYGLARHAAARFRRSPHRRAGRRVALSQVSHLAERVRTATLHYLRTDAKNRFAAIRDSLDDDDRTLLVLRVDRGMHWDEIARVLLPDATDDVLNREAARLRKRFQLVKLEIRSRARQAGLLPQSPAMGTIPPRV